MLTSSQIYRTLLIVLVAGSLPAQDVAPALNLLPPIPPAAANVPHLSPGGGGLNRNRTGATSGGAAMVGHLQVPVQSLPQALSQQIPQATFPQATFPQATFPQAGTQQWFVPSHQMAPTYPTSPYSVTPAQSQVYYWRVGTRHCGQSFKGGIAECTLSVNSCTSSGAWKPSSVEELLANLVPGAPICLMVHGSLVDEWGSRVDARGTYRWLRRAAPHLPLNVIFFDWPSQRCVGPHAQLQFIQLGRQAARNGFPLAHLITHLPADSPISLMGHSHGARTIAAATHLLAGGSVQGRALGHTDGVHRLRLVLAAAAIDHHWLNPGQRYDRVPGRAEGIVSLENQLDFALALYPLQKPFGLRPLGAIGLTRSDERALGANRQRISHINVARLLGKRHVWPYYYRQQQIADAVVPSVYFSDQYVQAQWITPGVIQSMPYSSAGVPQVYLP